MILIDFFNLRHFLFYYAIIRPLIAVRSFGSLSFDHPIDIVSELIKIIACSLVLGLTCYMIIVSLASYLVHDLLIKEHIVRMRRFTLFNHQNLVSIFTLWNVIASYQCSAN